MGTHSQGHDGQGGDGRVANYARQAGAVVALAGERRVGQAVSLGATIRTGATLGAGVGWPVGAARHPVVMSGAGTGRSSPFPRRKATWARYWPASLRQTRLCMVRCTWRPPRLKAQIHGRFQLMDQQPVRLGLSCTQS